MPESFSNDGKGDFFADSKMLFDLPRHERCNEGMNGSRKYVHHAACFEHRYSVEAAVIDELRLPAELPASKNPVGCSTDDLHKCRVSFDSGPVVRSGSPIVLHGDHKLIVNIVGQEWQPPCQLSSNDIDMRASTDFIAHGVLGRNALAHGKERIYLLIWQAQEVVDLARRDDNQRLVEQLRHDP